MLATVVLIGQSQLLAPAVSFFRDMSPHCLPLRQNYLVPLLIFVISCVGVVWVLYPAGFGGDLLRQKHLPFRFRVELLIYMTACGIVLAILVNLQRRLFGYLQARQVRKVSAAIYVASSIEQPDNKRPLGRKSFDGRDAVLRSTGSSDVGGWLRRTASSVGDVSAAANLPRRQLGQAGMQ